MRHPARVTVAVLLIAVAGLLAVAFADYAHNQVAGSGGSGSRNVLGMPGAWIAVKSGSRYRCCASLV